MSADTPQYQYFIPQFILKNFDHPFSCPKAPTNGSKCKNHHHEKGKYPGDRVVNFQDKTTGEFIRLGPRFHLFTPISPLLMIVLRGNHLPEPHEENNPETKAGRQLYRQIEIDSIHGPGTKSILEDLPVHKAINSYSTLLNGILRKRPGWDGQLRQTDIFSFPFFKIPTHHARIMHASSMVFC
ncbi:hypothetical protein BFJ71_g14207 [Fusarium oxysporum]|nr:hypothetical protein BFJ71_g14207 [Fusarium oxysporum]